MPEDLPRSDYKVMCKKKRAISWKVVRDESEPA